MSAFQISIRLFAVFIIACLLFLVWLSFQPHWEVSISNLNEGVQLQVFKSNEDSPTFETIFEGASFSSEIHRLRRSMVSTEAIETVFHDDSMRPGRWTFMLLSREVDVFPLRLDVDGETVDR